MIAEVLCPSCSTPLVYSEIGQTVTCGNCSAVYTIRQHDGIAYAVIPDGPAKSYPLIQEKKQYGHTSQNHVFRIVIFVIGLLLMTLVATVAFQALTSMPSTIQSTQSGVQNFYDVNTSKAPQFCGNTSYISFEGALTHDNNAVAITSIVQFSIYDSPTQGTMLYNESGLVIPDQQGVFYALIGSGERGSPAGVASWPLPRNGTYWLAVRVGTWGQYLSPRIQISPLCFSSDITQKYDASVRCGISSSTASPLCYYNESNDTYTQSLGGNTSMSNNPLVNIQSGYIINQSFDWFFVITFGIIFCTIFCTMFMKTSGFKI